MPLITVSQLNNYMKRYIDQNIHLSDLWIKGEVSNFKKHYSGHIYMTLKDEASCIKAVMFNSYAEKLKFMPNEGDKIIAFGKISVYERDGAYQLYVESMIPDGVGELYAAYEKLKAQLESEGLYSAEHKKTIPAFPKCIGVVSSVSGAALRDILNVISRRYSLADVIVYPVKVQGVGASDSICRGLHFFSEHKDCDVIILARGGGSIEDLWAFNEEKTARAIFSCLKPVVTGVGHETDYTISDFVSDLRAPTPSAAAELVTPSQTEIYDFLNNSKRKISACIELHIKHLEEKLSGVNKTELERKINSFYSTLISSLNILKTNLFSTFTKNNTEILNKLTSLSATLNALNPEKVLERGYSIISDENNEPIPPGEINCGDIINVLFNKGYMRCNVLEVKHEK